MNTASKSALCLNTAGFCLGPLAGSGIVVLLVVLCKFMYVAPEVLCACGIVEHVMSG